MRGGKRNGAGRKPKPRAEPSAPKPKGGRREGAGRPAGTITAKTRAIRAKVAADLELTAKATLEQIRRGSQFDIRALFDERGNLRPIHLLTAAEAMPIAGFEVVKRNITAGDDHTDTILKIKLVDRSRYVEMAAKHHGLLTDKIEVTGEVSFAEKIARARQRLKPPTG